MFLLQTFLFVLISFIAITSAIPAPPKDVQSEASENVESLKDGEEEKDLKASESAYHGYYGGYPLGLGGYPSYYYSSVNKFVKFKVLIK